MCNLILLIFVLQISKISVVLEIADLFQGLTVVGFTQKEMQERLKEKLKNNKTYSVTAVQKFKV